MAKTPKPQRRPRGRPAAVRTADINLPMPPSSPSPMVLARWQAAVARQLADARHVIGPAQITLALGYDPDAPRMRETPWIVADIVDALVIAGVVGSPGDVASCTTRWTAGVAASMAKICVAATAAPASNTRHKTRIRTHHEMEAA